MILIVSYPEEEHTALVTDHLVRQGHEVVQMDLSDFPARSALQGHWGGVDGTSVGDGVPPRFLIRQRDRWIDLAMARAVWWRRVRAFEVDPAIAPEQRSVFAQSETTEAIHGILDSLDCPWVNPREADAAAHHKPYQWSVARPLGLKLPRTLVTTDPRAAREFIATIGLGKVVFKPFLASIEEWRETRLVQQHDLDRLELVRYAPVIFQEYIAGVDLRITIIGAEIFAAEIDARHTSYPVDMRMVVGEGKVTAVTLPIALQEALRALQRRLNLVYGAIDMRCTDAGDYFFLEVNPAGQWLFVEQRTGLPIARALADHLAALAVGDLKRRR